MKKPESADMGEPLSGVSAVPTVARDRSSWWRTVLGEYPTGVTLITSVDRHGEPVGMVVGTFCAVSEEPPLIGFMPNSDSSTFPHIAAHGRFVASVLGNGHEDLCRAFARKRPDRFQIGEWVVEDGIPRVADAVAWFDGTVETIHPAGDHQIVVAAVNNFGGGGTSSGLPLLYLRGGYGSFTVPSLQFDVHGFGRQLKVVDAIKDRAQQFVEKYDMEGVICGLAGDSVVVLHAMNLQGRSVYINQQVGTAFPFAAPLAPNFAAWGSEDAVRTWTENSRHLRGFVDRPALEAILNTTRANQFSISRGNAIFEDFGRVTSNAEPSRAELAALWSAIISENEPVLADDVPDDATSIQVPIIGKGGSVELELAVSHFANAIAAQGGQEFCRSLREIGAELSSLAGQVSFSS